MELEYFIGKHILTGCQYGTLQLQDADSDSSTLDFILDGKIYSAIEDPEDGYRSMLNDILENREGLVITNTFEPCEVIGVFRADDDDYVNYVIDFYDSITGKVVMSFGTENVDDYYPCFIGSFNPENMAVNKDKGGI